MTVHSDPLSLRCIQACEQGSQMRALVEAIFHKSPRKVPAFADNAVITSDGFVMAGFKDRQGRDRGTSLVCEVDELVANCRGLADHLKLDDADRKAFFEEVQKWITIDYRAAGKAALE